MLTSEFMKVREEKFGKVLKDAQIEQENQKNLMKSAHKNQIQQQQYQQKQQISSRMASSSSISASSSKPQDNNKACSSTNSSVFMGTRPQGKLDETSSLLQEIDGIVGESRIEGLYRYLTRFLMYLIFISNISDYH